MGGKSRKTGGVSKKLIQRLMKEQQQKGQKGGAESKKRETEKGKKDEANGFGF